MSADGEITIFLEMKYDYLQFVTGTSMEMKFYSF